MKVDVKETKGCGREINVTVGKERVKKVYDKVFDEVKKEEKWTGTGKARSPLMS